jgi:hypothetical protein
MRWLLPLVLFGCGSVMMDDDVDVDGDPVDAEPDDFDPHYPPADADARDDTREVATTETEEEDDVTVDTVVDLVDGTDESPDASPDATPDSTTEAEADSGSTDIPYGDTGPVCNPEWCYATCLASGFARGECLPGWACNCTGGTECHGPFRGSAPEGRYVAYNVGITMGATCHVSTCSEFTGDTYLLIASGWNGENDNACGLGSEITAGPMVSTPALTVYVSCLSEECSWSITVDCSPDCTATL